MVELLIESLASCPECGCLVLAHPVLAPTGQTVVLTWDPSMADRRMIQSFLGYLRWHLWRQQGQKWGLKVGDWHECPPADHSPRDLWRIQRERQGPYVSPN